MSEVTESTREFYKCLYIILYELQSTGFYITTASFMRNNDNQMVLSTEISVHQFDEMYPVDMRLFIDEFIEYIKTFDKFFQIQITEMGANHCMIKWR